MTLNLNRNIGLAEFLNPAVLTQLKYSSPIHFLSSLLLVSSYCCFVSFPSVFQQNQIPKNPSSSRFLVTLHQIISFSLLLFLISILFSNKTKFQKKNPSVFVLVTQHQLLLTFPTSQLFYQIQIQVTEIVFAVAGKVSEYLVAPIGRQLGYLFCNRSQAEKLRNQVQTLRTARNDQQITVDEATRKGNEIRPAVREWLNRVDQITGEAEALMTDDQNMSCLNGWCPNLISRYQLGREAYKKAQVIVGIQTARNFPHGISYNVCWTS